MQSKAAHMCVLAVGSYRTSATISFLHKGHWNLLESMSGIVSGSKMNKIGKQIFFIVFFKKNFFESLRRTLFQFTLGLPDFFLYLSWKLFLLLDSFVWVLTALLDLTNVFLPGANLIAENWAIVQKN